MNMATVSSTTISTLSPYICPNIVGNQPAFDTELIVTKVWFDYAFGKVPVWFEEAIRQVDSGKFQCSFILNPTRVTEIRDVAAEGEKMTQKSTYFYPKMITGMVMNDIGVE